MLKKVKVLKYTEEDKKRLSFHTPDNYLEVIIQNFYLYNWRARLDIAEVLYEKWLDMRENQKEALAGQKNIFLEIYAKFFQISEDLALIGMMLLYNSKSEPGYLKFIDGDNKDLFAFYKMAQGGFGKKQIMKILGLDKIQNYISNNKSRLGKLELENYTKIFEDTVQIEIDNFKMLSRLFVSSDANETDLNVTPEQSGTYKAYNTVKHGFKLIHPTPLAKKLWLKIDEESVNVLHEGLADETSGKNLMALGGFDKVDEPIVEHIMKNIQYYADSIHTICEMWLSSKKSPEFVLKRLRLFNTKEKLSGGQKIKVNEMCLCGSGIKYKKCCKAFEYEFRNMDFQNFLGTNLN